MLICHLYIFFDEVSVKVFGPFVVFFFGVVESYILDGGNF